MIVVLEVLSPLPTLESVITTVGKYANTYVKHFNQKIGLLPFVSSCINNYNLRAKRQIRTYLCC